VLPALDEKRPVAKAAIIMRLTLRQTGAKTYSGH